jgi:importin-9
MVIGYNPSHSNINSEINAPFKILSLMLRYLDNELSPKKGKRPIQPPQDYDEEEEKQGSMITPGYKLRRDLLGDGDRLDTIEGDDDDDDYNQDSYKNAGATDKIEVNLDDVQDDEDNESLLGSKNNTGLLAGPSSGVPGLF